MSTKSDIKKKRFNRPLKSKMNYKKLFDADLAVLPIMLAEWQNTFEDAIIVYQNPQSIVKFGNLKGRTFKSIFFEICSENSAESYEKLQKNKKKICLAGKLNGIDVKLHSRSYGKVIQASISDNTEIFETRDKKQRAEIIESFLMIGSHELKTPLNGIMGISSLLLEKNLDKDTLSMLKLIYKSSTTLNNVVDKMLTNIYNHKNSDIINVVEEINISDSIMESWPLIKHYLCDHEFFLKNLSLNNTKSVHLPKGVFDDIIMEILINLKRNTKPGHRISISTFDKKESVLLKIENQSIGIPPEYLKKVFDPFFRYQDRMNHSSGFDFGKAGMGMGLTIVKRYIGQIGGKIWFENKYEYEEGKENVVILNIEFPT